MRFSIIALGLTCALATLGQAHAFGTLNSLGQHAEHERITRVALASLAPRTLTEIAGSGGSFGAVGAPDNPARGLLFESAAHCDNGDFLRREDLQSASGPPYPQTQAQAQAMLAACRAWIVKWLDKAVVDAAALAQPGKLNASLGCAFTGGRGRAKCNVLEDLGISFHAAQDFYAHTNWVDQPAAGPMGADNPPGLGASGRASWLDPRRATAFPPGLISGCFQAKPESLFCTYGDQHIARARHAALNKDEGPIGANGATGPGTTTRGARNGNFERAVAAAIEDTRDKWAYFEERVVATYGEQDGGRILCVMREDDRRRCRQDAPKAR